MDTYGVCIGAGLFIVFLVAGIQSGEIARDVKQLKHEVDELYFCSTFLLGIAAPSPWLRTGESLDILYVCIRRVPDFVLLVLFLLVSGYLCLLMLLLAGMLVVGLPYAAFLFYMDRFSSSKEAPSSPSPSIHPS